MYTTHPKLVESIQSSIERQEVFLAGESEPFDYWGNSMPKQNKEKVNRALKSIFRPEFLNRVDEIITFRSLTEDDFADIARIMLGELKTVLLEKGISLSYTDGAAEYIAKNSYSHKFGARNMRRFITKEVEDVLAERMICDYSGTISSVMIGYSEEENKLLIETL